MRRNVLLSLIAVLAMGAMGTASPALAREWKPKGAEGELLSPNVSLTATGVGTLTCKNTGAEFKPLAGATWETTPELGNCTKKVVSIAPKWEAVDVAAGEAELVLPAKAAVVELFAGCNLEVGPGKVKKANDYTAGKNGLREPSIWEIEGAVTVAESKANCTTFNLTSATIKATAFLFNLTTPATPITLE